MVRNSSGSIANQDAFISYCQDQIMEKNDFDEMKSNEFEDIIKKVLPNDSLKDSPNPTYTLTYTKNTFTLNEAKEYIEKKHDINPKTKKDYKALLAGKPVPEMPEIFAHIPSDDMVLYVKNPSDLWKILNEKSFFPSIENFSTQKAIQDFIKTFFGNDNFALFQEKVTDSFAIVVKNLDITSPEVVMVFPKKYRSLFENNKKWTIREDGDFIFIGKNSIITGSTIGRSEQSSLKNAADFQYVWSKKHDKITGAFMFVGDEFFEKMIILESFLKHYKKWKDYQELFTIQELVWAYQEAFGKYPDSYIDTIKELIPIKSNKPKASYLIDENGRVVE